MYSDPLRYHTHAVNGVAIVFLKKASSAGLMLCLTGERVPLMCQTPTDIMVYLCSEHIKHVGLHLQFVVERGDRGVKERDKFLF